MIDLSQGSDPFIFPKVFDQIDTSFLSETNLAIINMTEEENRSRLARVKRSASRFFVDPNGMIRTVE